MAVLRKNREFKVSDIEAAAIRNRFRGPFRDDDEDHVPAVFNPMAIAWGKVKPPPLPEPKKRTRRRAA